MIDNLIKDLTYEYLQNSELGEKLQPALKSLEKIQEACVVSLNDDSSDLLKKLRIGTILTFSILNKVISGKTVNDFDKNDWHDIATSVVEYAVIQGDERYSILIFTMYANYVEASANLLEQNNADIAKCEAIRCIAQDVRLLTSQFEEGEIKEIDYTEQCLWLLLEAMIKLIAAYSGIYLGADKSEFIQSAAMFAFEYGRYSMYRQEQELLQLYIEHQGQLDEELEQRLSEYIEALRKKQAEFDSLINDAFSADIMNRIKASVSIARNVGIAEDEILDTVDKVDDFFM